EKITGVARALRAGQPAVIMVSGSGLSETGLAAAGRIAQATGAKLRTPTQVPRMARGRGRFAIDRVPYVVDMALKALQGTRHLILAGAKAPVGFFAYPGKPSTLWPSDCEVQVLAEPGEDVAGALEALADELSAARELRPQEGLAQPELHGGPFKPDAFGLT